MRRAGGTGEWMGWGGGGGMYGMRKSSTRLRCQPIRIPIVEGTVSPASIPCFFLGLQHWWRTLRPLRVRTDENLIFHFRILHCTCWARFDAISPDARWIISPWMWGKGSPFLCIIAIFVWKWFYTVKVRHNVVFGRLRMGWYSANPASSTESHYANR